jgi:hypothetical protein
MRMRDAGAAIARELREEMLDTSGFSHAACRLPPAASWPRVRA